ncbi:hypothetical protein [Methylobacterium iners]|uniref:Uncharacterized protein n=1 Tax=Methylobacterium iners TaxID=418707 RepID=A0ABQ4S498_9HYPH|nr:hypothetical protein [Methylobacterium iners]GJD97309.1 hypothetical protein OCOJLMKI_4538 [Methylobacterium iners]
MKSTLSRLFALTGMLLIIGAAFALKRAGYAHAEIDALFAAGAAGVVTLTISS